MNTQIDIEAAITRDVEALRENFRQTPDLYREVCALLFFRYGITPTTNKLYQLVRKGSMSAPSQALTAFWHELREKSRVRIDHPDLPQALATMAGELVASLWTNAQAAASQSLQAYRHEADVAVQKMQAELAALEADKEGHLHAIEGLNSELTQAGHALAEKHDELIAAAATQSSLQAALSDEKDTSSRLQHQLEAARLQFGAELDKLRDAAKLADERTRATEKRLLLDIDRERTLQAAARKETETLGAQLRDLAVQHKQELNTVQQALGTARQDIGKLEGALSAATHNLERAENQVKDLQDQLHQAKFKAAQLQVRLEEVRAQAKADQRPKKARPGTKTLFARRTNKLQNQP